MNYLLENKVNYLQSTDRLLVYNYLYNLPSTSVIQVGNINNHTSFANNALNYMRGPHNVTILANTKTLFYTIDVKSTCKQFTVNGNLGFQTSDYNTISNDTLTLTINYGSNNVDIPFKLYPQFMNCIQFNYHEHTTQYIDKLHIYVTSTHDILFKQITPATTVAQTYIFFVSV